MNDYQIINIMDYNIVFFKIIFRLGMIYFKNNDVRHSQFFCIFMPYKIILQNTNYD